MTLYAIADHNVCKKVFEHLTRLEFDRVDAILSEMSVNINNIEVSFKNVLECVFPGFQHQYDDRNFREITDDGLKITTYILQKGFDLDKLNPLWSTILCQRFHALIVEYICTKKLDNKIHFDYILTRYISLENVTKIIEHARDTNSYNFRLGVHPRMYFDYINNLSNINCDTIALLLRINIDPYEIFGDTCLFYNEWFDHYISAYDAEYDRKYIEEKKNTLIRYLIEKNKKYEGKIQQIDDFIHDNN